MDWDMEEEDGGESPLYAYAFIPRAEMRGIYADRFTDVTSMLGRTGEEFEQLMRLYSSMGMEKENIAAMQDVPTAMLAMWKRILFRCDNAVAVCVVKTDSPITGEVMDALLTAKQRDGSLNEFIRASRIF